MKKSTLKLLKNNNTFFLLHIYCLFIPNCTGKHFFYLHINDFSKHTDTASMHMVFSRIVLLASR